MKKTTYMAVSAMLFLCGLCSWAQTPGRTDFSRGWSVVRNSDKDWMMLKYKMGLQAVELAPTVDLPHSLSVEESSKTKQSESLGKPEWRGYARYWKDFILFKDQLDGKKYVLEISGATAHPKMYCNKEYIGEADREAAVTKLDITDYLREGANSVMIDLNNSDGCGKCGGELGIYGSVWLVVGEQEYK